MGTVEGAIIYTKDLSSGRVHRRVQLGEELASLEGCNLDQAGAYEVLGSVDDVEPEDLCRRCFVEGRQGSGLD